MWHEVFSAREQHLQSCVSLHLGFIIVNIIMIVAISLIVIDVSTSHRGDEVKLVKPGPRHRGELKVERDSPRGEVGAWQKDSSRLQI